MKIHLINIQEDLDRLSDHLFNLREKPSEVIEHKFPGVIYELKGILAYAENVQANVRAANGTTRKFYPSEFVNGHE